MTNSKKHAGIIGPTLIIMNLTEMMTPHLWVNVAATQTYMAGLLWFVAGLSIARNHNIWSFNWTILVTLTGWFAVVIGLGRMAFPETVQQNTENNNSIIIGQAILIGVGAILTFKAYIREKSKPRETD